MLKNNNNSLITKKFFIIGTAMVCLQNLRKTFKYGGRKNVPSVEEISAISVSIYFIYK